MSHLLGGRLIHQQPADGHRSGIEPVLMAASIPARAGEQVLEGGTGCGAALLCLAARVPGVRGTGIERDAARAAMAAANFAANGLELTCVQGDLIEFIPPAPFDHAMANPPWHDQASTASPDTGRETARRGKPGLLAHWARALAKSVRYHGTVTLVVAAGLVPEALAALMEAGCGNLKLFPFWPRAGVPARLALVRGVRGGRGSARVMPGLVLHRDDGSFTVDTNSILRHGASLPL